MLSLIPLLIDDPSLPRHARDALIIADRAADPAVQVAARRRAGRILRSTYALDCDDLDDLLGFDSGQACGG